MESKIMQLWKQELGNIYQPNIACFFTIQVLNRSLLIALLFGATVAKPTKKNCLNFKNAALD